MISGGNDVIATTFHISLNAMTMGGRIAAIIVPPIAFYMTKRICSRSRPRIASSWSTASRPGIIRQLPNGEFVEVTRPLPPVRIPDMVPIENEHHTTDEAPNGGRHVVRRAGEALGRVFVSHEEQPDPEKLSGSGQQ